MAGAATKKPSYVLTAVMLLVANTVTVVLAYALLIEEQSVSDLGAAILLIGVIVAQAAWCGPFLPAFSWAATFPIAIVMTSLIDAHPSLDWSGSGGADQMTLAPLIPVIIVLYAVGFTLIVAIAYLAFVTVRRE